MGDSLELGEGKDWVEILSLRLEFNGLERLLLEGPVLDIGTSQGGFVYGVKTKYPNTLCIGIDISENRLRIARNRLNSQREYVRYDDRYEFITGTADALPFRDEAFSLLHSFLLLDYSGGIGRNIFSVEKLAEESHRIVKKGGIYIVAEGSSTVPNCFFDAGFQYLEPREHRFEGAVLLHKL